MNNDVTLPIASRVGAVPVTGPKPLESRGAAGNAASVKTEPTMGAETLRQAHKAEIKLDVHTLRQAVDEIQSQVQMVRRDLHFNIDEDLNKVVVKVVDHETGDVIRQIPSEEILAMLKRVRELGDSGAEPGAGVLFSGKV